MGHPYRSHGCVISDLRFWRLTYCVDEGPAKIVWEVLWDVVTTCPHWGVKLQA